MVPPTVRIIADDYGMHPDINAGILYCIEHRLVTGVSVAVCGEAAGKEQLQKLSECRRRNPWLRIGLHCMLTEANALSGVSSITDREGAFTTHVLGLFPPLLRGKISMSDVRSEWHRQVHVLTEAGLPIDHLDSHQHVHLYPGLWEQTLSLAEELRAATVRSGYQSVYDAIRTGNPHLVAFQLLARRRFTGRSGSGRTLGVLCSTKFEFSRISKQLAKSVARNEPVEIMVHPGFFSPAVEERFGYWHATWENEIKELKRLKAWIATVDTKGPISSSSL